MANSYFLYAEDDPDDIDIMREVMKAGQNSNDLVCVENGFMVIRFLQQIKKKEAYPCLIILDMHLPRINGIETLQLLKTDDIYRLIPVVIFTNSLFDDQLNICKSLGAEVLIKPSTYKEWQEILINLYSYIDD